MTAIAARHFDVLDYVDRSRALGADENLAKYQARQIEQAIEIAVSTARTEIENKELATKKDIKELELKIGQAKFEVIIWVVGLVTGLFIASGLIQHFFK